MRPGDPGDPLLRQVLPLDREMGAADGFSSDPIGELASPPAEGVLHKYHGRALVMVTGACAVHCRYCFRRHFPYADHAAAGRDLESTINRIALDPQIAEVILSGGDPLTAADSFLEEFARSLVEIPHVRRLRIHTRLPIVLPQRVDIQLIRWMKEIEVPLVVVVHTNHANEIDREVRRALASLETTGATLLNQSVLLAGVNDSISSLVELSETLFDAGVLPYYLHMLDRVAGAAHFEVSEDEAQKLMAAVRAALPGYLVPRLVREIPGAQAKIAVDLWS